MSQHTPMTIQDQGADGYVVLDSNGNFYARTYSSLDARLIAQAPAMLEALARAVEHIEEFYGGKLHDATDEERATVSSARAILRAVEGN